MRSALWIQPPERKPEAAGPKVCEGERQAGAWALGFQLGWSTGPVTRVPFLFILLFVSLMNGAWLLIGGEKDVKLIPTLIKTVSRLNMYEHILIWGLNRKEN